MPNGHLTIEERSKLDQFFGPITAALDNFAELHNLKLGKYYHDSPSWYFLFMHPAGGVGKINISRQNDDKICITWSWAFDDYDNFQRNLKTAAKSGLPVESEAISKELESGLHMMLSWKFGSWDKTYGDYTMWKKMTKEEFLKLQEQYPVPR